MTKMPAINRCRYVALPDQYLPHLQGYQGLMDGGEVMCKGS